jgi:hypothetical protein
MAVIATSTALASALGCEMVTLPGPQSPEALTGGLMGCILLSRGSAPETNLARYPILMRMQGESIVFTNVALDRRVTNNPYLYLKFTDGKGTELSDELFLGRCTQGLSVSARLFQQALAFANVGTRNSAPGASALVADGTLVLRGLHAIFVFRDGPQGSHTVESLHEVCIISESTKVFYPHASTLAGESRAITFQLLEGAKPIGKPIPVASMESVPVCRILQA